MSSTLDTLGKLTHTHWCSSNINPQTSDKRRKHLKGTVYWDTSAYTLHIVSGLLHVKNLHCRVIIINSWRGQDLESSMIPIFYFIDNYI